ncbi:MAG: dipeptide epimerase [Rhizobiales bacterium]|nr:dipeptide epimerase [Hyphomicrobiales bacterium]
MLKLALAHERWPIAGSFTISRGSKTHADVITVTLEEDGHVGRGECVPYGRYGETAEATLAALEQARPAIEAGLTRDRIAAYVTPLSGRNALDCALWDFEAKRKHTSVWRLAGLQAPHPIVTAYTLSLDTPEKMAAAAASASARPLLKLKLGRDGDVERLRLIRAAAPQSRLIVDANEGWAPGDLPRMLEVCAECGVEMVEQPLPASDDGALGRISRPVAVCADESAHDSHGLEGLRGKYDAVNIKLDKTGGLTEALVMREAARAMGFRIMVGCMLATSLAMAPAFLVAQGAEIADLDGPLLLKRDREPGIEFEGSLMHPPRPELWG